MLLLLIFAAAAAAAAAAVLLLCCWPLLLFAASTSMPRPHALTLTPHSSGCDRARVVLVLVVCSRCAFVHSVLVFVSVFCACRVLVVNVVLALCARDVFMLCSCLTCSDVVLVLVVRSSCARARGVLTLWSFV